MATLGDRLKLLREEAGLSRSECARRLHISYAALANYELSRSLPLQPIMVSICELFGTTAEWLTDGTGPCHKGLSRADELTGFCDAILHAEPADFRRRLVTALSRLSTKDWEVLEKIAAEIVARPAETQLDSDHADQMHEALQAQMDAQKRDSPQASGSTSSGVA